MQIVWNGQPVFIRRLTKAEVKQEDEYPKETILNPGYLPYYIFIAMSHPFQTEETLRCLWLVLFAHTWVAFPSLTWDHIMLRFSNIELGLGVHLPRIRLW